MLKPLSFRTRESCSSKSIPQHCRPLRRAQVVEYAAQYPIVTGCESSGPGRMPKVKKKSVLIRLSHWQRRVSHST